jgi:hypothetical protein
MTRYMLERIEEKELANSFDKEAVDYDKGTTII